MELGKIEHSRGKIEPNNIGWTEDYRATNGGWIAEQLRGWVARQCQPICVK